jgi:hypothetical protein
MDEEKKEGVGILVEFTHKLSFSGITLEDRKKSVTKYLKDFLIQIIKQKEGRF